MSVSVHKEVAPVSVACMVITVSDTRTTETDKSGKLIIDRLTENGHIVKSYSIVADDKEQIIDHVITGCQSIEIDAILINGGTGIANRDVTIEAIQPLFQKELTGFGEIFRMLSYTEDIGSAAILSRAIAGVAYRTAIFCMPGSTGAVKLAMDRLIIPELGHVIGELHKDK